MNDDFYHDREQSQVKHRVLQRYLQAFAPIIGSAYDEIVYVDCMAGPWESRDTALSDTSFDIALTVLRSCKREGRCRKVRALLIENNKERYRSLEEYARSISDIEVATRCWDFNDHISDIVSFVKRNRNSFPFFFIDPTGWKEARIDRIAPLLQVEPGEVLINFMSSWIIRFLDDESKPFEKLLNADVNHLRNLSGDELEDELVNLYATQVRGRGNYSYTCATPILMPDRDSIHYHLVFGTRGFKGLEEFKKTEAVSIPFMHDVRALAQRRRDEQKAGQGFLFDASHTYQENRYQRFNRRRLANARESIIGLLTRSGTVSYQNLFQESMQYSTVIEADLRQWLDEWKNEGKIRYRNWSPRQRVPHPDTTIDVLHELI